MDRSTSSQDGALARYGISREVSHSVLYSRAVIAQSVKNLPAVQETWVQSLSWEEPLEKEMDAHSSILAWRIPWTKEPVRLQSKESQRVRHD